MKRSHKLILGWLLLSLLGTGTLATCIVSYPRTVISGHYDCAIVLGAAVERDRPSPVFQARIDHAISLYKAGIVSCLIFTGGTGPGDLLAESEAARQAALQEGIPPSVIKIETVSKTTRQNLIRAGSLMREKGLGSALIVSDPLHLFRACTMAKDLGLEATGSAAPGTRYASLSTQLPFLLRETYFTVHYWFLGE